MPAPLLPRTRTPMHPDIRDFNAALDPSVRAICDLLADEIDEVLADAESKIWHRHPVWFLDGNPIAGYSHLKDGVRLLFWSGQAFREPGLTPQGSFKAAEARFTAPDQIDTAALRRWLLKSRELQWDYKNIVKRKGRLDWIGPGDEPLA